MEDHAHGRLRVMYVHLVLLTVSGWPAATDGLDGDLARLQQRPRRGRWPRTRVWRGSAGATSWVVLLLVMSPGCPCAGAELAVGEVDSPNWYRPVQVGSPGRADRLSLV